MINVYNQVKSILGSNWGVNKDDSLTLQRSAEIVSPVLQNKKETWILIQKMGALLEKINPDYNKCSFQVNFDGSLLPTEAEAYLIELRWPEPIPNYMLEAAFIKDDNIAEFLLSNMYGVYIKELGYTVLFTKLVDSSGLDLDVISEFDLTTYSFMQFTNYMDRYGSSQYFDFYLPLNDKAKARVDKFYEIAIENINNESLGKKSLMFLK